MDTEQTVNSTLINLRKATNPLKVSTTQILDAISNCNLPKWLKIVLQWFAAWTLRKKGYFSFLKTYLGLAGAMLITRPKVWAWIIFKFFEENSPLGKALLAIVEFFDGIFDSVVFWVISIIVVLVVILNFIVEFQKNKNKKELTKLLDEITFNPEKDWFDSKCSLAIKALGNRYSSKVNYKNPRLSNVYKVLVSPEYWDRNFKKSLEEFVRGSKHLFDLLPDDTRHSFSDIGLKINSIIEIYNTKHQDKYFLLFEYSNDIVEAFREIMYRDRKSVSSYQFRKIADSFKILEDYEAVCQFTSNPVLYIKGDAGTGKSHLLADIVTERMSRNLKSLLALGFDFTEKGDVRSRLMNIWGVKGIWDDFLERLNKIAELEKHRILMLQDFVSREARFGVLLS